MAIIPLTLRSDYWDTFKIQDSDLEFLYNYLLEAETPLTSQELIAALIWERIKNEKKALENQVLSEGKIYLPKDDYEVGQKLIFPVFHWKTGRVTGVRPGNNPEVPTFNVIEVAMEGGEKHQFASHLADHRLNEPLTVKLDDPLLDPNLVMERYGEELAENLEESLSTNPDLVRIARRWFPRALLVDVNIGHLNLAEAVLDMMGGGPVATKTILDQIELPTDVNLKLTEFSLNLALQEDGRFDEVGPAGEVTWFLKRLEPEQVQQTPVYLRYNPVNYDRSLLTQDMLALEAELDDELTQTEQGKAPQIQEATIRLTYPHWRAGTLPISNRIQRLFPTAYESQRIQFTLVLGEEGQRVSAWVVRQNRYVFGLREWYIAHNIIPGSLIHIRKSKTPGEVMVQAEKRRPTREWIRTVLVGADGGIVFAMLKQNVVTNFDERMVIAVPDVEGVDQVWEQSSRQRLSFENAVTNTMRELSKLNLQGHVHAQELYSAVNIIRRSPPGPIFSTLASRPWFIHVGDLYYRVDEEALEERKG
ncbi:MAG TPA: hypothetical protein VMT46_12290 [Anaerolineaceae bacterium]|nr:hypothetical protein [Anaerolineaceae bacterium]